MRQKNKNFGKIVLVVLALLFSVENLQAVSPSSFVVVLDAGHGGKDPGAVSGKNYEKDINLAIVLSLGEEIEKNHPDVKVVYTRKKDIYLTLQDRANVANNSHADLFISVHTNANKSSTASGTETYTLGLTQSQSNLDVAMRENSVILLEDDYKVKYAGFNPNSPDSYIMFECIQDRYLEKSVQFASDVQSSFARTGRKDKGVRQAGFWVLHKAAMPSILVEVGYISNKEERDFLMTGDGRTQTAKAIYESFAKFKKEYERKSGKQNYVSDKNETLASNSNQSIEKKTITDVAQNKNADKVEKKELDKPVEKVEPIVAEPTKMTKEEEIQTQQFLDKMKAEANVKEEKPTLKQTTTSTTPQTQPKAAVAVEPKKTETKPVAATTAPKKTEIVVTVPKTEVKTETKPVATTTAPKKTEIAVTTPKTEVKAETKPVAVTTAPKKTEIAATTPKTEAKTETKPAEITTTAKKTEPSVVSAKKETKLESKPAQQSSAGAVVYKLQLFALSKKKALTDPAFKGLKVDYFEEAGLFKYTYGNTSDYQKIILTKKEIADKFPGAIVIALKDGKKIPVEEALKNK